MQMKKMKLAVHATMVALMLALGMGQIPGGLVGEAQGAAVPETFATLAKQVSPAVVNINTEKVMKRPNMPRGFGGRQSPFGPDDPFHDFFERFFGEMPKEFKSRSLGSGFIFDKEGFIITNNHVVAGADKIKVKLSDGREFTGTIKGRDPSTDLALIKIDNPTGELPVLPLGDSDAMQVGDWVLAVGNPFGLSSTVTQGIISAKSRVIGAGPYDDFLQTDASINPGNSGGPLINIKGEVIGINTAIVASGQGIGFAIPSSMAKTIIPQLKEKGKVTRGMLGIQVQVVTPELAKSFGEKEPRGALVADVNPETPAAKAGIQRGDIIVDFNGHAIKEMHELPRIVAATPPGTSATMKFLRQGKEKTVTVTVGELKPEQLAQAAGGEEDEGDKASLGMAVQDLNPALAQRLRIRETSGVVVTQVLPGSPAAEAGIQPRDLIEEVDGKVVQNTKDLNAAISKAKSGSAVRLLLKRRGKTLYAVVNVP